MINKIFTFIIILSFSSFLLSGEAAKTSDKVKTKPAKIESKEKTKPERVKYKEKLISVKEKKNINRVKPVSQIAQDQQIKLLYKEFESRQMEIEKNYRSEVNNLNLQKERDLEALKREMKNKMNRNRKRIIFFMK